MVEVIEWIGICEELVISGGRAKTSVVEADLRPKGKWIHKPTMWFGALVMMISLNLTVADFRDAQVEANKLSQGKGSSTDELPPAIPSAMCLARVAQCHRVVLMRLGAPSIMELGSQILASGICLERYIPDYGVMTGQIWRQSTKNDEQLLRSDGSYRTDCLPRLVSHKDHQTSSIELTYSMRRCTNCLGGLDSYNICLEEGLTVTQ
ncbi:hypothetical protein Tco_0621662 [Tanacetum coccineum]